MDISLTKKINGILDSQNESGRNYIGASSIGAQCDRKIWYQFKGEPQNIDTKLKITFEIGNRLEAMVLDYLDYTDIKVTRPCEENRMLFCCDKDHIAFCGHMDAILTMPHSGEQAILDVKTAKASSYTRFVTGGLKFWNIQYYAQLQAYMGMTGIKHAVLLAINKDSSEMHEEWIEFDADYYEELKSKAIRLMEMEEEPPRINSNRVFYLCRMCSFRDKCHD